MSPSQSPDEINQRDLETNMTAPSVALPPSNPPLLDTDQYLWHFTSQEGLSKILREDDGLLAGHALFMKDTEDCSLLRRLNKVEVGLGSLIVQKHFGNTDIEDARTVMKKTADSGTYRSVFIACFTTTTKEPKMWAEYTKDGGFAIGFDKEQLISELEACQKTHRNILWNKCDYLSLSNSVYEMEQLEKAFSMIEKGTTANLSIEDIAKPFMRCREITEDLVFRKSAELSWENEMRLAYVFEQGEIPASRLRFIDGKPFVTLELSAPISTYVRCIRISPFGDVEKSRAIAQLVGASIGLSLNSIIDERME